MMPPRSFCKLFGNKVTRRKQGIIFQGFPPKIYQENISEIKRALLRFKSKGPSDGWITIDRQPSPICVSYCCWYKEYPNIATINFSQEFMSRKKCCGIFWIKVPACCADCRHLNDVTTNTTTLEKIEDRACNWLDRHHFILFAIMLLCWSWIIVVCTSTGLEDIRIYCNIIDPCTLHCVHTNLSLY